MATAESIRLAPSPELHYVLRIADTALIHAQRLSEWCGQGPILEEDIALTNMALDLLGQARSLLSLAARIEGSGYDEDQLAFLREQADFFNLSLVELPLQRGGADFAATVLRNFLLASWMKALWEGLAASSMPDLAAIAGKAVKEARYHQQHAADWVVRLGDGTAESARRLAAALRAAWPYTREMFQADEVDRHAASAGLGPSRAALKGAWTRDVEDVFGEAKMTVPTATPFVSAGTCGRHTEHMGYLLAEMQGLQRQFPGGRW